MKKPIATCVLLCATLLNPGCGGTGTGNPTLFAGGPTNATQSAAASVLAAICATLDGCFPSLTYTQCSAGVLAQTNLAAPLGLPSGFGSFQAIYSAESAGTIIPVATAESVCLTALNALVCSNAAVQSAYSGGAPTDFSQVFNLIPTSSTSCGGLY